MKNLYLIAALSLFGVCAVVARAEGAERAKKPTVCVDYEIASTKGGIIGVCYDGKRPVVLNMFSEVVVSAGDAEHPKATRKVLVGWR